METPLPRFYFHLYNDEVLLDEVGEIFPDPAAAREAAIVSASELIAEHIAEGRLVDLRHRLEVEDEGHNPTATIQFGGLFKGYRELCPPEADEDRAGSGR